MAPAVVPLCVLLLALSAARTSAQLLSAAVWRNAAFAPDAAALRTTVAGASVDGLGLTDFASVRLEGTVSPASADPALNFSVVSEGGVRLFVDDIMVIDAGGLHNASASGQGRAAFQTIAVAAGVPLSFRLEYSRWTSDAPPTLALFWQGSATPLALVPPSALSPEVSPALSARAALRDRLVSPAQCPWQTHYRRSATAHTLAPTGLVVVASLVDAATNAVMRDIIVQRGGAAYVSRAGPHSANGSDYTQFAVWAWNGLDCNVSIETTAVGAAAGDPLSQLQFLASSAGADCGRLRLVVQPAFFDERVGTAEPAPGGGGAFFVDLPGFLSVAVAPVGAAPVPLNASVAPPGVPYFALPLTSRVVGYCAAPGGRAISCPPVAVMQANIAAARARATSAFARLGDLAAVHEAIASSALWSAIFTVHEGVVAIVSRNPNWSGNTEFVADYVLFCWDSFFIALGAVASASAGTGSGGQLLDLGIATLLQVTLARTPKGFVPNWKSGSHSSNDRSENQVGAVVSRLAVSLLPPEMRAWVVALLFPPLLSWHEWVWSSRIARGGPFAGEPLFALGSDPALPHDNGDGTMQGARYESMDNSPCYDSPPVAFNSTTHQIEQYDISPSALFVSDAEALIVLAVDAGRADVVPLLQARFGEAAAALNARLWLDEAGAYVNRLFNGSFNVRIAPSSFYPLLSGVASDEQALELGALLASPRGFCVNASHSPGNATATGLVTRWLSSRTRRTTSCASADCAGDVLLYGRAGFVAAEASVPLFSASLPRPPGALVALNAYRSPASGNATALATAPPDATFVFEGQQAWCFAAPPPPGAAFRPWPLTTLTLWRLGGAAPAFVDLMTCGSAACEASAAAAGYALVGGGAMCYAFDASMPDTLPCVVPVPSIARSDAAFFEQNYWRGRAWAPQALLVFLGLQRYDRLPALRAMRLDLVALGRSILLGEFLRFGHVAENYNAITGFTQDSGDADPMYAWGSAWGLMAVLERGQG